MSMPRLRCGSGWLRCRAGPPRRKRERVLHAVPCASRIRLRHREARAARPEAVGWPAPRFHARRDTRQFEDWFACSRRSLSRSPRAVEPPQRAGYRGRARARRASDGAVAGRARRRCVNRAPGCDLRGALTKRYAPANARVMRAASTATPGRAPSRGSAEIANIMKHGVQERGRA